MPQTKDFRAMANEAGGYVAALPLEGITIPEDRLRELRDFSGLAESMERVGLLQPITATKSGRLVAGRHRVEAARSLGWKAIPAFVVEDDELRNRLAEIDENLQRLDLTVYEQSKHAEERERVLEALGRRRGAGRHPNPATAAGLEDEPPRHDDGAKSTADVAAEAGMSERSWQQRAKIGKAFGPKTRAVLDMADPEEEKHRNFLNSTTQLNTVADIASKRGDSVAAEVTESVLNGEHSNVYDAYPPYKEEQKKRREKFEEAAENIKNPALTSEQKAPRRIGEDLRAWEKLDFDAVAATAKTSEAAESLGYDADRLIAVGKLLKEACVKRERELKPGRMEVVR